MFKANTTALCLEVYNTCGHKMYESNSPEGGGIRRSVVSFMYYAWSDVILLESRPVSQKCKL